MGSQLPESSATLAVTSAALKGGSAVGAMPSSLACSSAIHACAAEHSELTLSFCSCSMCAYSSSVDATKAPYLANAASSALKASGRSSASRSRAMMFATSALSSSSFATYTALVASAPSSYSQSSVAVSLAEMLLASSSVANLLYLVPMAS